MCVCVCKIIQILRLPRKLQTYIPAKNSLFHLKSFDNKLCILHWSISTIFYNCKISNKLQLKAEIWKQNIEKNPLMSLFFFIYLLNFTLRTVSDFLIYRNSLTSTYRKCIRRCPDWLAHQQPEKINGNTDMEFYLLIPLAAKESLKK